MAEERERCAGEASMAQGHGLATPWGGRVTHGHHPSGPVGHTCPTQEEGDVAMFDWFKNLSFLLLLNAFPSLHFHIP